tara:strand:+ start:91 stop:567 length:477 start_codon:yes stop_codon:yes gene_type:complete
MIIECVNCSKKFDVNSELIPTEGRTIQCGSCDHVWFYKKSDEKLIIKKSTENTKESEISTKKELPKNTQKKYQINNKKKNISNKPKGSEIVEYVPTKRFSFGKLLSYIIVIIITFISIIIVLDTFKNHLYNALPGLEFLLFSLYETLKDINLFIKDLF